MKVYVPDFVYVFWSVSDRSKDKKAILYPLCVNSINVLWMLRRTGMTLFTCVSRWIK